MIINAGIRRMVSFSPYADKTFPDLFKEAGLEFVGRDSGLPFDDAEIKLYHDFYEIADVVRRRPKG